jgi:argininosuccinate lyase
VTPTVSPIALKRINVMPLGAAALAGTTYPIDRHYTAELLEFPQHCGQQHGCGVGSGFHPRIPIGRQYLHGPFQPHVRRAGAVVHVRVRVHRARGRFRHRQQHHAPEKNPDIPELIRGKTGRVFGDLIALLTLMKSLPLAYNRDMQEDKPPLFDAVDTLQSCLDITIKMLPAITIKSEAMRRAASIGFLNATDMADYLVGQGVAFRSAHAIVGHAVAFALAQGKELHELTLKELQAFSKVIQNDIFDHLTLEQMISRRQSTGGTSSDNVRAAIEAANKQLGRQDGTQ